MLSKALKKYRNSRKIGSVLGISHTAVLKKLKKYHLQADLFQNQKMET